MKICIIGTGYVGLVTGACFAQTGNTVYCVDKDQSKIENLKKGQITIYEPGLSDIVIENTKKGHLIFTTDLALGINNADVCFIAVGTPQDKDGSADLSYVRGVCHDICNVATKSVIIATKSTVPVGTGDQIEALFKENLKYPFIVFSNPEFLKEGDAVNDFLKPDRIVIGTNDTSLIPLMEELYAPYTHQSNRILFMDRRSAEITKYAANAMLALRISFMNEVANFCDATGANVNDVRRGIGSDPRIGSSFLYPGLGYGGSCFPKDVKALIRVAQDAQSPFKTLQACDEANLAQVIKFYDKIVSHYGSAEALKNKTFALWGLAFKARTDDIRESRAIELAQLLKNAGAKIKAHDPKAMNNVELEYPDLATFCKSSDETLQDADALIIATEWSDYKTPNFSLLKSQLKDKIIFDARNLYSATTVKNAGLKYVGVGVR